jgi:hypothetical protein
MTIPPLVFPALWMPWMWAAMWATASLASMAINPHGYDTFWEAVTDISSDIALGAWTWYLWWLWSIKYEKEWIKLFSKEFYNNPKFIMAWDLIFLWLVPEAYRMKKIDEIYHNQNILDNTKK